ncbi:CHAT domain-containing protein [Streptomyces spiramyceticus]|uniref:CHAT domain-containing protein n=1 Tax=Streptomyces spiramyceticus TaxID=299717 RepID=UPI00237BEA59|nr:CHAT domain-containing protein [Streptomyces spiramyceticus]
MSSPIEKFVAEFESPAVPTAAYSTAWTAIDRALSQPTEEEGRRVILNALVDQGPWLLRIVNTCAAQQPGNLRMQVAERMVNEFALEFIASASTVGRADEGEARAVIGVWHARREPSSPAVLCYAGNAIDSLPRGHPWRDENLVSRYFETAEGLARESGSNDLALCLFSQITRDEPTEGTDQRALELVSLIENLAPGQRKTALLGIVSHAIKRDETPQHGSQPAASGSLLEAASIALETLVRDYTESAHDLALTGRSAIALGLPEIADSAFKAALSIAGEELDAPTAEFLIDYLRLLWASDQHEEITEVGTRLIDILEHAYREAVDPIQTERMSYAYWHAVAFSAMALIRQDSMSSARRAVALIDRSAGIRFRRDIDLRLSHFGPRAREIERALRITARGGKIATEDWPSGPSFGGNLTTSMSPEVQLREKYRRLLMESEQRAQQAANSNLVHESRVITLSFLQDSLVMGDYEDTRATQPSRVQVLQRDDLLLPFRHGSSSWVDQFRGIRAPQSQAELEKFIDTFEPVAAVIRNWLSGSTGALHVVLEAHGGLGLVPWWACSSLVDVDVRMRLARDTPARRQADGPKVAVVVGDPCGDLDAARLEGSYVTAKLRQNGWAVTHLTGADASRQSVLTAAKDARLLHYAGHGLSRPWDPGASGLLLESGLTHDPFPSAFQRIEEWAELRTDLATYIRYGSANGILLIERYHGQQLLERVLETEEQVLFGHYNEDGQLEGIADLLAARELAMSDGLEHCELAFLSACSSGVPAISRHLHEPGGLSAALSLAGARTVVGALWPVRDLDALVFAQSFYDELLGSEEKSDVQHLIGRVRRSLRHMSGSDAAKRIMTLLPYAKDAEEFAWLGRYAEGISSVHRPFEARLSHAGFYAV